MRAWLAGLVAGLAMAGSAVAGESPHGRWITASGNVEVEIAPCGQALCGTVAKVLANRSMADPTKVLAGKPATVGLAILTDLMPDGPGRWKGRIYNRENGKTYDCLISPQGQTMNVRAYVVLPVIGQTQVWRRVEG
jgi:uncharacterized protein (DUF2147 family)